MGWRKADKSSGWIVFSVGLLRTVSLACPMIQGKLVQWNCEMRRSKAEMIEKGNGKNRYIYVISPKVQVKFSSMRTIFQLVCCADQSLCSYNNKSRAGLQCETWQL